MKAKRRWSAAAVAAAHAGLLAVLVSAAPPPAPAGSSARPPLWVSLLSEAPALPAPAPAPPPPLPPAVPVLAVPAVALAAAAAAPVATAPTPAPAPEPVLLRVAVAPPAPPEPPANAPAVRREPPGHAGCAQAPHPPLLRERGIEGQVQLRVQVGADGHARQVLLLQSSGWRLFDEAALAQARGCRFRPAREGDSPVDAWVEFPVRFTLRG